MQHHSRRAILGGLSALALPLRAVAADRPLKIVFPFAPGGSGNSIARLFAEQLHTRFGRVAIVENLAGAGGRIGAQAVKNAAPGEETLLFASASQFSLQPHLFRALGYDPELDFVPLSQVMTVDLALAVSGKLPIHSAKRVDRLDQGQSRAGGVRLAGGRHCTSFHLQRVWPDHRAEPAPRSLQGDACCSPGSAGWPGSDVHGVSFRTAGAAPGAAAYGSSRPQGALDLPSCPKPQLSRKPGSISTRPDGLHSMPPRILPVSSLSAWERDHCDRERSRNAHEDSRHGLRADRNNVRRTQTDRTRRLRTLGADREGIRIPD